MSQKVCTCGASEYNNTAQSTLPQQQTAQRRQTKPVVAATGEVYVIIRARNEHYQVMKNFMVLESKIIENYKGTIIGLAKQVSLAESPEGGSVWVSGTGVSRYCVMVLRFDSLSNAQLWSFSDPVFKQQDCLRPNEMIEGFIVPMKHLPPDDCRAFMLMNITNVRNHQAFQERYIDQVVPILNDNRVEQGVVSSDDIEGLRRSWIKRGDFVFVHQAKSANDIANVLNSDQYAELREARENWADCETLVFTLSLDPLKPKRR